MKKLAIILSILFVGISYGQNTDKTSNTSKKEIQYWYDIFESSPEAIRVKAINLSSTYTAPSSISSGSKTVTTSASSLTSSTPAKFVVITNVSGTTVYYGGSGVTTSNGIPIYNNEQHYISIDDASKIYVISGSGSVSIRFAIFN